MPVEARESTVQLEGRRPVSTERQAHSSIRVGKDILELVSSAMYVDPLSLFREYIQNSADAIDEAHERGLFVGCSEGRISINLDPITRDIRIRDNGIGIAQKEAERLLTAFGASAKRGTARRGFRGVGRLAGLGYSQKLTFRTKAAGEDVATEVQWDCRKLKSILRDATYDGDLGEVVRNVVSIKSLASAALDDHFFEVQLEKPIRVKNDLLLNEEVVRSYVRQVAPLGFDPALPFGKELSAKLSTVLSKPRFTVSINQGDNALTRPFAEAFAVSGGRTDCLRGYEWIEVRDSDETLRAVGWIAEHGYLGAIQAAPELRGLRARVGDIQVGGDDIFVQIFPEARFNAWTIGELHILDRNLLPNGRRDNFEQNGAYHSLISQLAPLGRALAKRCRDSSSRRNREKRFDACEQKAIDGISLLKQNAISLPTAAAIEADVERKLEEMNRLARTLASHPVEATVLLSRVARLRESVISLGKPRRRGGILSAVNSRKRGTYQEVLSIVYECMPNAQAAKELIDRVTARLSAS